MTPRCTKAKHCSTSASCEHSRSLSPPFSSFYLPVCSCVCVCVCVEPLKSNQPICTQPVCPGVLLFFFLYLFNKARFPDAASKRHVAVAARGEKAGLIDSSRISILRERMRERERRVTTSWFVCLSAELHGSTEDRQSEDSCH